MLRPCSVVEMTWLLARQYLHRWTVGRISIQSICSLWWCSCEGWSSNVELEPLLERVSECQARLGHVDCDNHDISSISNLKFRLPWQAIFIGCSQKRVGGFLRADGVHTTNATHVFQLNRHRSPPKNTLHQTELASNKIEWASRRLPANLQTGLIVNPGWLTQDSLSARIHTFYQWLPSVNAILRLGKM